RLFTLEEATAMLPELRDLLPRLRQARRDLIEASGRVTAQVRASRGVAAAPILPELRGLLPRLPQARRDLIEASGRVTAKVAADGGGVAEPAWFRAQQQMKRDLTALADAGILLRDPEIGLVDFPSIRDGERVYLCW